jgi:hypothetical protein
MHYINLGLIFVGGISLCFAIFIWLINKKNRINIYFSIALAAVSFWSAAEGVMLLVPDEQYVKIFGTLTYFFGIIIVFIFLFFTFYFPFEVKRFKVGLKIFFIILFILGIIFCVTPNFLVRRGIVGTNGLNNDLILNPFGFWLYAFVFFLFAFWSFYNLISKYVSVQGFTKTQVGSILFGTLIFFLFSVTFDLLIPYFKGEIYGSVGPYATLVMLVFIAYLLFFAGKKIYIR